MKEKNRKSELFGFGKGWWTILYCLLMFWFYAGMVNDSSNVVAPAVAAKLGIPAGNVLNMGTVAAMVGVIFFFIMGAVNRKIGARITSCICLILGAVGYFGMGHANSLAQYGISLCICTIGCMSAGYISGGALVASWFPKKKGIVMGYTTMGHNLSTGFFVPMITVLVARLGVTRAVVLPCVLLLVLAVVGLAAVRNNPQDRGINPDNVSDEVYRSEYFAEEVEDDGGWTVRRLFRRKTFWLVAVASGGFQFVSTVIITQLVVRNQEVGFTQAQAVGIMTILAFAGIVGSWIIGAMDQKLGTRKTMIFFGIWYAAALLLEVTENVCISPRQLPEYVRMLQRLCEPYGFAPNITNYVSSANSLTLNINSDNEVFICDRYYLDVNAEKHVKVPLRGTHSSIVLAWRKENEKPYLKDVVEETLRFFG